MRIMQVLATALVLGMGGGFWISPPTAAQEVQGTKSVTPAAKVGDEIIPREELEQALSAQLAKIEQQRFQFLEQRLSTVVGVDYESQP